MIELNCSTVSNHQGLSLFERVAYTPVFIVGLSFNITALCMFCRIKRWTDTHIYMLNLLAADFLAIVFLPFKIVDTFCRMKPTLLCTFLLCAQYSNMYCSIFTITTISIHRFIGVRFPFLTKSLISKSRTIATMKCVFIWATILVICASNHKDLLPDQLHHCYDRNLAQKLRTNFFLILEILGYVVPVVIVIFCSTQTIFILVRSLRHVEGRDRVERKTIAAVVAANMFTFIVCFTPVHVGLLLQYLLAGPANHFVHVFHNVSEWIATTNCCLDSIGYYFLFRRVHRRDNGT